MKLATARRSQTRDDLAAAAAAAADCGVTRLADVTRLDRIGAPVFQAVRPWSRALSVHMGKGLDVESAQLGALMEAVESARAEAFQAAPLHASFKDLPPGERAPELADFAVSRDEPPSPDRPLAWTPALKVLGGRLWVPFDAVSLDFTRRGEPAIERSSNGLAARFDAAEAAAMALLELVERDAVATWLARPLFSRGAEELELASVPFDWFDDLVARARRAGLQLCVHHLPAVIDAPVFLCQLIEPDDPRLAARAYGSACHPDPQAALLKAVLEALQSRLAFVSGARDDVYFPPEAAAFAFGFSLPLPPHVQARDWAAVMQAHAAAPPPAPEPIARALAEAGYADAAVVELSPPGARIAVAKAFCPGLAAFDRSRRPPC